MEQEDLLKLDINYLNRKGMLQPGSSSLVRWSQQGEDLASIRVYGGGDQVMLRYKYAGSEDIAQSVGLEFTPCNFGGERPWFQCPRCQKRVGTLLGGRHFYCRKCLGVVYYTQQCGTLDRLMHRMHKLERRLERSGLHKKTIRNLTCQIEQLDQQIGDIFFARFGYWM